MQKRSLAAARIAVVNLNRYYAYKVRTYLQKKKA